MGKHQFVKWACFGSKHSSSVFNTPWAFICDVPILSQFSLAGSSTSSPPHQVAALLPRDLLRTHRQGGAAKTNRWRWCCWWRRCCCWWWCWWLQCSQIVATLYSEMPMAVIIGSPLLQEMNMVWLSSFIDLLAMSTTSGEWYDHQQSSKCHTSFLSFLILDKSPFSNVFAAGALRGAVQVMQMTTVQFEGVYLNLLKMHRIQNESISTIFQESWLRLSHLWEQVPFFASPESSHAIWRWR